MVENNSSFDFVFRQWFTLIVAMSILIIIFSSEHIVAKMNMFSNPQSIHGDPVSVISDDNLSCDYDDEVNMVNMIRLMDVVNMTPVEIRNIDLTCFRGLNNYDNPITSFVLSWYV